ncbi:MAG: DUF1365 domain-containing protein [Verrucomicrobiota bacterium]
MTGRSKIYRGEVTHQRMGPVKHAFTYPMSFFGFDLEELDSIEKKTSLFGHNQSRPLRLNDSDYLRGKSTDILEQLSEFLPQEKPGQSTLLISSPRYFNYAFNPVNFHLRMEGEDLLCAVAEVNNTFGDRHIYALNELKHEGGSKWSAHCPKDFHVSPFNDVAGEYHFTFRIKEEEIFLGVDLWKHGECVMKTWIHGKGIPLSNQAIIRYALLHPFDTALNSMPRILWQAAVLYFSKKMEVFKRPSPKSKRTVIDRDQPTNDQKII